MTDWTKKDKISTNIQKLIDWFARGWFSYGWFTGEPGYSFTKASKPVTVWNKE